MIESDGVPLARLARHSRGIGPHAVRAPGAFSLDESAAPARRRQRQHRNRHSQQTAPATHTASPYPARPSLPAPRRAGVGTFGPSRSKARGEGRFHVVLPAPDRLIQCGMAAVLQGKRGGPMILKTSSTEMGGAESAFPKTRWSVIRDAGDAESPASRQSLEDLARLYWRPIYAYFRRKWRRSNEEAKDLTQEFFAALSDKGFLEGLRPENGRFRSYVMAALDNFARGDHRRATALKRGGGVAHLSFEISAGFEPSTGASPEEEFESQGKESEFRLFEARDIEASTDGVVSYEELSGRFGMRVTQVTHALYFARKRLRELVLRRARDSVTSAGAGEEEMIRLFSERAR